jgi:hypothetical protein
MYMRLRNNPKANHKVNSNQTRKRRTYTQKQIQDEATCMRITWRKIVSLVRSI